MRAGVPKSEGPDVAAELDDEPAVPGAGNGRRAQIEQVRRLRVPRHVVELVRHVRAHQHVALPARRELVLVRVRLRQAEHLHVHPLTAVQPAVADVTPERAPLQVQEPRLDPVLREVERVQEPLRADVAAEARSSAQR